MVIDVLKDNVLICRRHVCCFMHILCPFLSSLLFFSRYRLLGHGWLVCILNVLFFHCSLSPYILVLFPFSSHQQTT